MEAPICEVCGEEPASLQTSDCGLCDDCFAAEMTRAMKPILGRKICGHPIRFRGDDAVLCVCLEPYGTEHSHP